MRKLFKILILVTIFVLSFFAVSNFMATPISSAAMADGTKTFDQGQFLCPGPRKDCYIVVEYSPAGPVD